MADWKLIFRAPRSSENRASNEAIANAVSSVLGAPVTVEQGEVGGNPYDTFYAQAWMRGQHATAPVLVEVDVQQWASHLAADPVNGDIFIYVKGLPSATAEKHAVCRGLRDALAAIGYTDDTDHTTLV